METSGIIGSYNAGKHIAEAVRSLAPQVDEIIVVDDSSTDQTWETLLNLTQEISNLNITRNSHNLGVSETYNRAVSISQGKFLVFQGADDVSTFNRVDRQMEMFRTRPSLRVVFSRPTLIGESGLLLTPAEAPEFFSLRDVSLFDLLFIGNFLLAPSATMRRDAFIEKGGFVSQLDLLQDWELWLRFWSDGIGGVEIDNQSILRYRKWLGSLSSPRKLGDSKAIREKLEREFVLKDFIKNASPKVLDLLAKQSGLVRLVGLDESQLRVLFARVLKIDLDTVSQFENLLSEYHKREGILIADALITRSKLHELVHALASTHLGE